MKDIGIVLVSTGLGTVVGVFAMALLIASRAHQPQPEIDRPDYTNWGG